MAMKTFIFRLIQTLLGHGIILFLHSFLLAPQLSQQTSVVIVIILPPTYLAESTRPLPILACVIL